MIGMLDIKKVGKCSSRQKVSNHVINYRQLTEITAGLGSRDLKTFGYVHVPLFIT